MHARQVKQLKGRKTDVADSVWLACVCQFGLCTPSHVPPEPFRELRSLSRQRRVLVRQRSTVRNRVQKIIDRAGVRIGGSSRTSSASTAARILDGLAQGTEPQVILASLTGHVANKLEGLGEALTLSLGDNDRFMLSDLLEEHDALEARIASYTKKIDEQMTPWEEQLRLLTTIPGNRPHRRLDHPDRDRPRHRGVRLQAALRRLGRALSRQQREAAESAATRAPRMGSKTLRAALVECAHGAARTKGCQFEAHHRALAARRGYKRAIVAGAHKMLRIIYVVLKNGRPYYDRTADYEALMVKRKRPAMDPHAPPLRLR